MRPLKFLFRWLQVVWVTAWALVCAFVVVALSLSAGDEPVDWKIIAGIAALAAIALPFGLFLIQRIGKTLDRAGESTPAEPTEKEGRVLRLLTGLFGLVCIGGGLFAGLNGKFYEGGSRGVARAIDAPVMAWVFGGIAILIGLALFSVPLAKPARDEYNSEKSDRSS